MLKLFLIFFISLNINSLPTDFVSIAIDLHVIVEIEPIINYKIENQYYEPRKIKSRIISKRIH